jgi:hypothetical protein
VAMHGKTLFVYVLIVILIALIIYSDSLPNTLKIIVGMSYSQKETEEQKIPSSESVQNNASTMFS